MTSATSARSKPTPAPGVHADSDGATWWRIGRYEGAVYVLLALASAALFVIFTRSGLGIADDSVSYRAIAESISSGAGPHYWLENPMVQWPPGYPYLLRAIVALSPLTFDGAAYLVNLLSMPAVVLLSAVLMARTVRTPWVRVAGVALVALGPGLFRLSTWMLSEVLFLVPALGFLVLLQVMIDQRSSPRTRALAAAGAVVLCWLAFMTRYAGVALIPAAFIVLLVVPWGRAWRYRAGAAVVFGAAASAVPATWMLRNYLATGDVGPRWLSGATLSDAATETLRTLSYWFAPTRPTSFAIGLAILVVVLVFGGLAGFVALRPESRVSRHRALAVVPLCTFVVVYSAFIVYSRAFGPLSALDARLLGPILIPLVVTVAWSIESIALSLAREGAPAGRRARYGSAVLLLIVGVWISAMLARAVTSETEDNSAGRGHLKPRISESELYLAMPALNLDCDLYSNHPRALFATSGVRALAIDSEAVSAARSSSRRVCVVFAEKAARKIGGREVLTIEDLEAEFVLDSIAQFEDGQVVELRSRAGESFEDHSDADG